jgi:hypothetical protein
VRYGRAHLRRWADGAARAHRSIRRRSGPQPAVDGEDELLVFGAPSGAAPTAFVRHGLSDQLDLGVEVAGSSLRGNFRGRIGLGSLAHLVIGVTPHAGAVYDGNSNAAAFRGGALVPVALTLDISGLYEAWIGVRAGIEHVTGELGESAVSLSGVRAGGVVGLAVGFRRLHVLLELAVDHEHWWGALGDQDVERNGIALTPAFALRLRL